MGDLLFAPAPPAKTRVRRPAGLLAQSIWRKGPGDEPKSHGVSSLAREFANVGELLPYSLPGDNSGTKKL